MSRYELSQKGARVCISSCEIVHKFSGRSGNSGEVFGKGKIYGYLIFTGVFTGFRAILTAQFRDAQLLIYNISYGSGSNILAINGWIFGYIQS